MRKIVLKNKIVFKNNGFIKYLLKKIRNLMGATIFLKILIILSTLLT